MPHFSKFRFIVPGLAVILSVIMTGCSWLPDQIDETKDWSASRLYSEAKSEMTSENYEEAVKYFGLLETRFPFGRYARQAQIEIAYAYYKFDEPDSALAAVDRFIKLYPTHPHVDYAYYLRGIINYNRGFTLIERFFPQDPASRDPGAAKQAFFDFQKLIRKFPNSHYVQDAKLRMLYLRNNLANYEILVARYYMKRGAYVAAVNRAKYVLEHYDRSSAVYNALIIMGEAYDELGMPDLAKDARRVFAASYPEDYKQLKKSKRWWNIF